MILPAQAIRALCVDREHPLIKPYNERIAVDGMTAGLGPCTYDMRLAQRLTLWPIWMLPVYGLLQLARLLTRRMIEPHIHCFFALGSTIERVQLPNDICGTVMDKSSGARRGLSVFNTKFDPGFWGFPTVELHNCGLHILRFRRGTPICQFKFERLEEPTQMPYDGRYQGQGREPTPYRPAVGAWD